MITSSEFRTYTRSPPSFASTSTDTKNVIEFFFDLKGTGPSVTGRSIRNGSTLAEGITCQPNSRAGWLASAIVSGGGCALSMRSVIKQVNIVVLPFDLSMPTRLTEIRFTEIGGFLGLLFCRFPPSMTRHTSPSAVAPPKNIGADIRMLAPIRGWSSCGKSMISTGGTGGIKVLEGALRSFSADDVRRIGDVDLPREGIVVP